MVFPLFMQPVLQEKLFGFTCQHTLLSTLREAKYLPKRKFRHKRNRCGIMSIKTTLKTERKKEVGYSITTTEY